jgi:hypothetical protein
MSTKSNPTVATTGIDIGKKTRSTLSASISAAQSGGGRSGHAARSKRGSPTCRRA